MPLSFKQPLITPANLKLPANTRATCDDGDCAFFETSQGQIGLMLPEIHLYPVTD
jgi:hypothetical protein